MQTGQHFIKFTTITGYNFFQHEQSSSFWFHYCYSWDETISFVIELLHMFFFSFITASNNMDINCTTIYDCSVKLYPVLKDAKRQGKHAVLVRDKLFINGSQYFVDDTDEATHVNRISYRDCLLTTPKEADRPYKRQRRSDSSPLVTGNAY